MNDGICNPAVCIRAHQILGLVCRAGGADCPLLSAQEGQKLADALKRDPTTPIRLTSTADEIPYYAKLWPEDLAQANTADVFNRKRDLDILHRLGLAPGDTRRARYLFELLFQRVLTPMGICAYDTPGWEGCPHAASGAYESIRAKSWQAMVYARSDAEMQEYRRRNAARVETADRLYMRPHHLMCVSCWYAGGEGQGLRPNDSLSEILQRIRKNPDIPIVLIEGCCMACDCCDGFFPDNGRCVHSCGLIRDYKKDLDVFQRLGLMPGATLPARDAFQRIFDRIASTREICGYGDGIVTSDEWLICGGPEGNPGYEATRRTGIFG